MLLTGDSNTCDNSSCSRFASGDRHIPKYMKKELQKLSDEELLRRFNDLTINLPDCLSVFRELLNCGYIEIDDMQKASFSRKPQTDKEILFLLMNLFKYSLTCIDKKIEKLTDEQLYILHNGLGKASKVNLTDSSNSPTNTFIDNYSKTMFWSTCSKNTLENLYVYNSYRIPHQPNSYDDLERLINEFINGDLIRYLRSSKVSLCYTKADGILIKMRGWNRWKY